MISIDIIINDGFCINFIESMMMTKWPTLIQTLLPPVFISLSALTRLHIPAPLDSHRAFAIYLPVAIVNHSVGLRDSDWACSELIDLTLISSSATGRYFLENSLLSNTSWLLLLMPYSRHRALHFQTAGLLVLPGILKNRSLKVFLIKSFENKCLFFLTVAGSLISHCCSQRWKSFTSKLHIHQNAVWCH